MSPVYQTVFGMWSVSSVYAMFGAWSASLAYQTVFVVWSVSPADEEKSRERKEVRARYLMEKYVGRWRQRMWRTPEQTVRLTQTTWLHTAIFSPSSRSARQTACSVVESISQVASHRKEVIDMLTGSVALAEVVSVCSLYYGFLQVASHCMVINMLMESVAVTEVVKCSLYCWFLSVW